MLGRTGLYHVPIPVPSGGSPATDAATNPAWNLGAGVGYTVGPVAPFLEIRYVAAGALRGYPRTMFIPVVLGIRFGGR